MPVLHPALPVWSACAALALVSVPLVAACSSSGSVDGTAAGAGAMGQAGSTTATGGVGSGGSSATGGAGTAAVGGDTTTMGGIANGGAATGGNNGDDPCAIPATHTLNITAAVGEHNHGTSGLDTRAKTMLGKLVLDYGVKGGSYISYLAKRGYHSIGAPTFTECMAPDLVGDRTRVGKCRLGEIATTQAAIEAKLAQLQTQYPEEDWGYFLDAKGKLRWSDVTTTGLSHGATTAAITGRAAACVWRVVSRSGPRDNTCGATAGTCSMPLSASAYNAACTDDNVAEWLDEPSKTPMERFYALVGMQDTQCGDIMFHMHRTGYLGVPTVFDVAGADLSTTHQFFSSTQGHANFFGSGALNQDTVLETAFGIPPENRSPKF